MNIRRCFLPSFLILRTKDCPKRLIGVRTMKKDLFKYLIDGICQLIVVMAISWNGFERRSDHVNGSRSLSLAIFYNQISNPMAYDAFMDPPYLERACARVPVSGLSVILHCMPSQRHLVRHLSKKLYMNLLAWSKRIFLLCFFPNNATKHTIFL